MTLVWLLYLFLNLFQLDVLTQISSWLGNPEIHYTPIHIQGVLSAIFAVAQILILGTVTSHVLLKDEDDMLLRRICAVGLGFGFIGLITILLGIFGLLYKYPIIVLNFLLIVGFIVFGTYRETKLNPRSLWIFSPQ